MKLDVVERKPVRVAYLRYTGPFGEPVGRFWRGTVAPWLGDHGLIDCPRYGLAVDDPLRTPADSCRYDACVELPPGLSLPDAPETIVPGGRYARVHFKGSGADIGPAWKDFRRAFDANPAFTLDGARPAFEHYPRGAGYDARTGQFACELCLPVAG
jgi:AraC family transcriptional regulator